jgi:acetyltransferase-like isoleucine patch superfamily enzyme
MREDDRTLNLFKPLLQRAYEWFAVRDNVQIGKRVHVGFGSVLWAPNLLVVGDDVYIGKYCTIECDGEIGSGVLIANQVGLVGRHDHDWRAMGVPVRRSPWIGNPTYAGLGSGLRVVIEDDVWVGYGAIVLSGVRVGRGAIVAAGAVVIDDVEEYAIVAGNPARRVSERLPTDAVDEHERELREKWGI